MKYSTILIFIAGSIIAVFTISQLQSCSHEPIGIENLRTICFESEVLPMLQNSCGMSGCHDGHSEPSRSFVPTDYASIVKHVKPGNANGSTLYKVLGSSYLTIMPPDRPLTKDQRTLIEVWIEQGAKDTKCDTSTISGN
jgi:hypothetical protein